MSSSHARLLVILYTRGRVLYWQQQANPLPGVFNWVQIWQLRQLWHLFDMVFVFIKLVNDHARPADDGAVILQESTCIWGNCKKHIIERGAIIIQRFLPCSRLSGPRASQKKMHFACFHESYLYVDEVRPLFFLLALYVWFSTIRDKPPVYRDDIKRSRTERWKKGPSWAGNRQKENKRLLNGWFIL